MADDDDFSDYPKARISVGPGDLIDVYDGSVTFEDGEKIVATLRQNPAGSTGGTRSCTLAIKAAISSAGFERDFLGPYEKRKVMNVRFKIPGVVVAVTGRWTKPSIMSNVDNFIDFSITLIGRGKKINA